MCDDVGVHDEQQPLTGFTVGVTAERKAEEIGGLLSRRGARVLYGAAMHTVPLPEDGELASATSEVLSAPVDIAIAITGVGFRGWLEAAEANGVRDRLVEHLRSATLLARGAKAKGAIRGAGLLEEWTSPAEESAEVLDHLLARGVSGARIVLQVHGDPMLRFQSELRDAGAEVVPVTVYRWTDPLDLPALDDLIDAVLAGEVDALPFTSAPAATNLLNRADRTGRGGRFRELLREKVLIACVGPVTAAPIAAAGLPYVMPDRARTGALVRLVAEELPKLGR
ncbi:uroporphyrinogen-III synthase [Saccharopolyspora erythraea NRRL 2338]|uniref:Uroporphyrinogen-III synthetase n=1 Tax=Saccharopolyspora erythraea (strain ATCC 11635 / DSM 40517 / JCM 4748 / NBRC 13426 / NCIMB 8594 / NRRL 2338) TaxID=405948 RepID=A4F8N1_SACEN|nr:uroporphyrinogen III synthase [Saccharopolyspora erythraea D]PFG94200.1 uroporphyrinogen-III synthase [Saccharopolyspora erythraea NRRL 2338]CAM00406.1 uroporphyrinogen-III synthetase [Saccharopolyspora erythraea NRRL 2338]